MKMLLDGRWVDREERMPVCDPQDGRVIDYVPKASSADVYLALDAADRARRVARAMPVHQRMAVLQRAADLLLQRTEPFAQLIAQEGIKTIREARREASRAADTLRLSAEEARRLTGETVAFDQRPGSEQRVGYWTREPVGIVLAFTPFNDPLNLVAHKLGPAIASGNAAILKPHEQTPLCALSLAELLLEAGLPAEILQVLTGDGTEIGPLLVADPRVRMISFTGGGATGALVAQQAGLKKLSLELGSNCPTLVMADADLDLAIPAIISGAFWAAGQNCLHVQRVLIHRACYDTVKAHLVNSVAAYRTGAKLDPHTDMGPLVNEASARRIHALVQEEVAGGATLLTGGTYQGTRYAPTFIENVPVSTALYQKEIYGPVTILEQFSSYHEAIRKANSVPFGLQSSVFTQNLDLALQAVHDLEYGAVVINDSSDYRMDAMPFGGIKGSGLGREGVRFAALDMTELKLTCINVQRAR